MWVGKRPLTKEKAACLVITQLGMSICGGWECAVLCTKNRDSLDGGCGQQPAECWDFEFLASFNFSNGLQPLRTSGPAKGMQGSGCRSRRPSSQFCFSLS